MTPVFNGSASLRNAAGQMVENVTKSMRRKETVDDAYFEKLKGDITALYRLDGKGAMADGKADLGELPATAKILIATLVIIWSILLISALWDAYKKRKKRV